MPAVSFSQLDSLVERARKTPTSETRDAAVQALLSFVRADNPKQRIKASTLLPEFHEISVQHRGTIHEAIFDLCEDPLEHVRIAGYHAIVDLSKRASAVRRKNADVLCQLLQSEGASELAVVRSCLSQHLRTTPDVTYSIFAEYLVTNDGNGPKRGPLMNVVLQFLDGGGLGSSWTDAAHNVSSNVAMDSFRQRDVEGGKGALLEVSWLQRNTLADAILKKSLLSALPCATLEEAQIITLGILFSMYSQCIPLGMDATELLDAIIEVSKLHARKKAPETNTPIDNALPWLHLGLSALSPITSPIPSFEPDPLLPRADPTPLLKACHTWIQSPLWERHSLDSRMQLTVILGVALRACNASLKNGRKLADGRGLTSTLLSTRNSIIDSMDPILRSWIDSNGYNGNDGTHQTVSELVLATSERKTEAKQSLSPDQITLFQHLQKAALSQSKRTNSTHLQELMQRLNLILLPSPSQKTVLPTKPTTNPLISLASPPPPRETPIDALSRKRVRKDLEGADQPTQPSHDEERNVKRQRIGAADPLSLLQKHRTPSVSPNIPVSLASRIENSPDTQMMDVANPKQKASVDTHTTASRFSIKGAAATKPIEKNNSTPQAQPVHGGLPEPPRPPALNRGSSVTSVMQKLNIRPAASTSGSFVNSSNGGIRTQSSSKSPAEIEDSVKLLLLGKTGGGSSNHGPPAALFQNTPRSSLLDRISGGGRPSPTSASQTSAPTIFDRVGIPQGARGNGNTGARNNGPKKRGT
ncbi:hypothetical protein M408DRAFT_19050 [Serendipita vermifera MAFF 305830]|uniref:Uncharacterized protein n=1 Tax=Serendipita vermifera MAFF 305830 TaxID=933852 RepID=A0A0C2XZ30_SERVB|nr:hypothetical protein M408DRAFT_19050 [Serendipita vermifera MAFF 305830]